MNCVVLDDEPFSIQLLEKYLSRMHSVCVTGLFNDSRKAADFIANNPVDVVFLDINMPDISGLEFSSLLPAHIHVIFTTAHSEYAVESYTRGASDYLLKPIEFERLVKAVHRVAQNVTAAPVRKSSMIFVKQGREYVRIDSNEIYYIESMKDYVTFHGSKAKHMTLETMKHLEESLPPEFIRIHHSYIVNLNKLDSFKDNHIHVGGIQLPVSTKYYNRLMAEIKSRLL